jgi:glucose-6-phosphate dehydrogenase assembly protein OpcA
MTTADGPLAGIEGELTRQLAEGHDPAAPLLRARMSNLLIYCADERAAEQVRAELPALVTVHPARVLLVVAQAEGDDTLSAAVAAWCQIDEGHRVCTEEISLRVGGRRLPGLSFAVRALVVGDMPTNLWWTPDVPPPGAGPVLNELTRQAEQLVYDSTGWDDRARGFPAVARWLPDFERPAVAGPRRRACDLNWLRLRPWRRLLAQALDPAAVPGLLDAVTEVIFLHGPQAAARAWLLAGWVVSRLGWEVGTAHPTEGGLTWDLSTAVRTVRLVLLRATDGPADRLEIRLNARPGGRPVGLHVGQEEDGRRLAARLSAESHAARTLAMPPQSPAVLVARQLSERDHDPAFAGSLAAAKALADRLNLD